MEEAQKRFEELIAPAPLPQVVEELPPAPVRKKKVVKAMVPKSK